MRFGLRARWYTFGLAVVCAAASGGMIDTSSASARADTVVRTSSGSIEGVASGDVVRFLGVPYAAPPVGRLRWRSPQPVAAWHGVRQADHSAPPCAQGAALAGASEDCLYVNVTVPQRAASRLPVMVWLHGGGFSGGAGSDYDPTRMAEQGDVIVVTVDFRLGMYGFFGHTGLPGSGTFGLQDQQAALRWVRRDIAAFGGDAHNVTLFGQSGGSVGTCAQLTSPSSAGLFERAIMESGTCGMNWPARAMTPDGPAGSFFKPVAQVDATGAAATAALHCTRSTDAGSLDCLRGLSPQDLNSQYSSFGVVATGNAVLPLEPDVALRDGLFHRVPVMSGGTRDEHRLIAGILDLAGWRISAEEYPGLIAQSFGALAPAVLARYPLSRYGNDGALAWAAVFTDRIWACGEVSTGNALARWVPTYMYEFGDEHAQPFVDLPPDISAGASHASELPALFDVAGRKLIGSSYYTDAQRRLARTMISYWTGFARSGRPGSGWPVTVPGSADRPGLELAPGGVRLVDVGAEHQCGFWG